MAVMVLIELVFHIIITSPTTIVSRQGSSSLLYSLSLSLSLIYLSFAMHVSAFMTPAAKVHSVTRHDSIAAALQLVVEHNISAVVVTGDYEDEPVGILTNKDLVLAYHKNLAQHENVSVLLNNNNKNNNKLDTLLDTDSRDTAAKMLHQCGRHHALVVNAQGHFVGLLSAYDVVREVARDAAAWPYPRTDDGKVHPPTSPKKQQPTTTTTTPDKQV